MSILSVIRIADHARKQRGGKCTIAETGEEDYKFEHEFGGKEVEEELSENSGFSRSC
jgi:hypothetical protein